MKSKYLLLIFPLLTLLIEFFHPIAAFNQDLGRHILTGQIIWQTHSVPKNNLFSYTYANFPFINHHWFSEVIYYLIQSLFGVNSLLVFSTLLILIAFSTLIFFLMKENDSVESIIITAAIFLPIVAGRTDIRPELFSALFLAIFLVILYQFQKNQTKLVWILPIIQLFWSNMHIYFPIGIAVAGLFFLDQLWQDKKITSPVKTLGILTALCGLATIINPNGLSGALYPLRVFQNYGYSIEENQNMFFIWNYAHRPTTLFFFIATSFLTLSSLINFTKTKRIDLFLSLLFAVLAYSMERNLLLFFIGAFIPFARSASLFIKKWSFQLRTAVIFLALIICGWQINRSLQMNGFGFGTQAEAQAGVDFMEQHHITGPLFNNFDIGSYLEYRLYPQEKVFIDGRPEAYPASFIQQVYIPMQQDPKIFSKVDQQYHFNTIFLAYTDQTPWSFTFEQNILNNPNWSLVYLDDASLILVKNTKTNQALIARYGMDQTHLRISGDINNKNALLRLFILFQNLGWKDQQLSIAQKLIELDPTNCYMIYFLAVNSPNEAIRGLYEQKFGTECR